MTPAFQSTVPEQASRGSSHPWCGACGMDTYLFIGTGGASRTVPGQSREISYTCVQCDGRYAHDAGTESTSTGTLDQFPPQAAEVMGGFYRHCREPMTRGVTAERSILSTLSSGAEEESELEVYMRTMVLHCRCGFNIELPPPGEG